MESAPSKQFFGEPSDMITPLPRWSTSETEPFPAFDDAPFDDPSTPRPNENRSGQQATGNTSPPQPSPDTISRIRDTIKTRLNARYTAEQQEEVIELILEVLLEQQQKPSKTTSDAMIYVQALEECKAILNKLHLEHQDAMLKFKRALGPVQAHLDSQLSSALSTEASLRHQLSEAGHHAFRTDDFDDPFGANKPDSPAPVQNDQTNVMPVRSLEAISEEDDSDVPESMHTNSFTHEMPQIQRNALSSLSPVERCEGNS